MQNHHVLAGIIGKIIEGIVATKSSNPPEYKLFFAFDDNTYIELYGNQFKVAGDLDKGSLSDAVLYAEKQPGTKQFVYRRERYPPPKKLRIMADWGPAYAWDEDGLCTLIADYFPDHPQLEQLKELEEKLEEWATSLYGDNNKAEDFTLEKFDQVGLALAEELAVLLADYGVWITYSPEQSTKIGSKSYRVEVHVTGKD